MVSDLCALESQERRAIATYRHCGAGLCVDHWREADSFSVGGMCDGRAHRDQAGKVPKAETESG